MSKTVMIVEDDQSFHNIYTEMLKDTDYGIIRAYDGAEALVKLGKKKPDLIILDMILGMMNGDKFFLYLKGMPEYKDIPVIIISNQSKREYKNLRDMDPNLVFLDKIVTREILIEEIKTKIR
jgi:CheY-like chemotaxis protein